ncbi:MAG: hypothetical protein IKC09_05145 [Oscillospiraceae bacterium]|nr:hypothetical protein [Oscillospiraceae bacterium]
MKELLLIIAAFVTIMIFIFIPGIGYLFGLGLGGLVLVLWLIHATVKSAVKDALREYDEEKKKDNGQK